MTLDTINSMPETEAQAALIRCCGSENWVQAMVRARPFHHFGQVLELADIFWDHASEQDVLQAFAAHPKIGDKKSLAKKFANTASWAGNEQSGVDHASDEIIERLAIGNKAYEEKFGYIFIVCATGKSAKEMLTLLEQRINNDAPVEFEIAKTEQRKITHLRLNKLLS